MPSKEIFLFFVLFTAVQAEAECGIDAQGQSTCFEEADEATLLQAKLRMTTRKEIALEFELAADADPATTKILKGIPIYNYHLAHAGGMKPSLLELSEKKEWIVVFKDGATDEQMKKFCKSKCSVIGHPDEGGEAFADIEVSEKELEELMDDPETVNPEFLEPLMEVHIPPHEEKIDPSLLEESRSGVPWGLDRIDDQRGTDGSYSAVSGSAEGRGAHVYVADTGVNWQHNDFGGRARPLIECLGRGGCTECSSRSTSCAADRQGHGTHCAGTVGGSQYGVAKRASIYGVKVLGDDGSGSSLGIMGSLDWILSKGSKPAIWSASLGGRGTSQSYKNAINRAVSGGIIVSVAAGNENSNACNFSPAFVPNAITVGSTDSRDRRSSFSNYGSCVDIFAPGSSIKSLSHRSTSGTATMSGTSMACPHVSGVMALIMSDNPSFSPSQAESMLKNTGVGGVISDAKSGSPNLLLNNQYSGGGGGGPRPSPQPSPRPSPRPSPQPTQCEDQHSGCPGYASYCNQPVTLNGVDIKEYCAKTCGTCSPNPSPRPSPNPSPRPSPNPSPRPSPNPSPGGQCNKYMCTSSSDCTNFPSYCSGCGASDAINCGGGGGNPRPAPRPSPTPAPRPAPRPTPAPSGQCANWCTNQYCTGTWASYCTGCAICTGSGDSRRRRSSSGGGSGSCRKSICDLPADCHYSFCSGCSECR